MALAVHTVFVSERNIQSPKEDSMGTSLSSE